MKKQNFISFLSDTMFACLPYAWDAEFWLVMLAGLPYMNTNNELYTSGRNDFFQGKKVKFKENIFLKI